MSRQLDGIIGVVMPYENGGVSWEIEVFDGFREQHSDSIVFVTTDEVRVKIGMLDMIRGKNHILEKIYDTYHKSLNLE
jgi:hypothetical protein